MGDEQQPSKPPTGEAPKGVPEKPVAPDPIIVKGTEGAGDKIITAVPPRPSITGAPRPKDGE